MEQEELVEFLDFFEEHGINVIIDGGWGIDALLGEQTRSHNDLDVAVERKDSTKLLDLLMDYGFRALPRKDTSDWNYALYDDADRIIDIHVFEFDENGKHIYGIKYPFESLKGSGMIGRKKVRCITPEGMVKFHETYELDEKAKLDVRLLCDKFNIPLPESVK